MDNKKLFLSLIIITFIFAIVISKLFLKNENKNAHFSEGRLIGPLNATDPQVIELLRNNYLNPPSKEPYNLSINLSYNGGKNKFSWIFIHYYIKTLFSSQNEKNGFFVEAGALDGEFLSNSLWLEQNLNWNGLLIEPDINNYNSLVSKHRKAWSSNTCLSTTKYAKESTLVSIRSSFKHQAHYIQWLFRGGAHEVNPNTNKEVGLDAISYKSYSTMKCFPLQTYLEALNVSTIDFLSLDTQGSEIEIIKTIPFDKYKIRVIAMECMLNGFDFELIKVMDKLGYLLLDVFGEPDYIFVLNNDIALHNVDIPTVDTIYERYKKGYAIWLS